MTRGRGLLAATLVTASVAVLVVVAAGGDSSEGVSTAVSEAGLAFDTDGWETDFSEHSVPLTEFRSGGPPRDGIPPIDEPKYVSAEDAADFVGPREPVMVVEQGGSARAYPLQIMVWHEIVNDELAGRPIAVTHCPLCNSAVVFDRRVDGRELTFGTTGNLRHSDLVMWDRQTESWWQQLTAEAVVGELTGKRLEVLPSQTLSFEDFRRRFPEADVLSRDTGFDRDYGTTPYAGYDAVADEQPFLLKGEADDRLPPKSRVAAVFNEGHTLVLPFERLEDEPAVNERVGGDPRGRLLRLASVLGEPAIAGSEAVGTAAAFERRIKGRELTFEQRQERFLDEQTGSVWDITGRAVSGPLAGSRLVPSATTSSSGSRSPPSSRTPASRDEGSGCASERDAGRARRIHAIAVGPRSSLARRGAHDRRPDPRRDRGRRSDVRGPNHGRESGGGALATTPEPVEPSSDHEVERAQPGASRY